MPADVELEWECHACGETRPDAMISVAHVPLPGAEDAFPSTRQNVRYCNDRPACYEKAKLGLPGVHRPEGGPRS